MIFLMDFKGDALARRSSVRAASGRAFARYALLQCWTSWRSTAPRGGLRADGRVTGRFAMSLSFIRSWSRMPQRRAQRQFCAASPRFNFMGDFFRSISTRLEPIVLHFVNAPAPGTRLWRARFAGELSRLVRLIAVAGLGRVARHRCGGGPGRRSRL
jgi:hypothetical protein